MMLALPHLTTFDPAASSEGTLDPLGLYQIADQLATKLVPAVRERMQRIRFLTAMAVGSYATEGLEPDPEQPDCLPYLIWEWLVIESLVRTYGDEGDLRGVPGTQVTRRALADYGYLDYRSYLKTPRIFGFHGVYKRLAIHLGLIDVHLGPRPACERLVDAWARDQGYKGLRDAQQLLGKWRDAVQRGLSSRPCRTRPAWNGDDWAELATALLPGNADRREKKCLTQLLHSQDERALGALPSIWTLQQEFDNEAYVEELLHARLRETLPSAQSLLEAIATYEAFCRSLKDGFDLIRASASKQDARGFEIPSIADDADFVGSLAKLDHRYEQARRTLEEVDLQVAALFDNRFSRFAQPMDAAESARLICEHHETTQKRKSADGKRAWFDRLGPDRIYVRQQYRTFTPEIMPDHYVHDYRGRPIRKFYFDL